VSVCIYMCVCVRARARVCVCVCGGNGPEIQGVRGYCLFRWVCVFVCSVCVCLFPFSMCVCARVCAATTVLKIKASRATVSFDGYVCVYVVCVCVRVFFSICVRA